MDALFTAFDTTGLSTNVSTLMTAFIGIGLLFIAVHYIRRGRAAGSKV